MLTPYTKEVESRFQSIVVDVKGKKEIITGIWRDLDTAKRMAVQSIIDMQIQAVWESSDRVYPKACWDE